MTRFSVTFLALVAALALLSSTVWAQTRIHVPLGRLLAALAAPVLGAFGRVQASGNHLMFEDFTGSVEEACDGVLPTLIYVAAVLALPSRWRDKGWGILLGVPAIFTLNLLRVITLMLCGAHWPDLFERVHIYVWQALVIGLSMGIWVFWAERFVRRTARLGP